VALGIVYVVWGSTYLAIRVMVETMPPLLSSGVRFTLAGVIFLVAVRALGGRGRISASPRELAGAFAIGMLLCFGGNGLVSVAEREVPSGLTALVIGSVPLWVVILRALHRDRVPMPTDVFAATAWQMLFGGLGTLVIAFAAGEGADAHPAQFSTDSILALAYLVAIGSLVAYTAYTWLLRNAPISKVATYAYVNPVIAIVLGAVILDEEITLPMVVGAIAIVASVAIVVRRESAARERAAAAT
jgi:drug/metabolite transporter (DMT)-like permease